MLTYSGKYLYAEKFHQHDLGYFPKSKGALSPKATHTCKCERSKETVKDPQWNCLWSLWACGCVYTEHMPPLQMKLNTTTLNKWQVYISLCPRGVLKIFVGQFGKQDSWNGQSRITTPTAEKSQHALRPRTKTVPWGRQGKDVVSLEPVELHLPSLSPQSPFISGKFLTALIG